MNACGEEERMNQASKPIYFLKCRTRVKQGILYEKREKSLVTSSTDKTSNDAFMSVQFNEQQKGRKLNQDT